MSADYSCSDCCSSSISKFPPPPPRKWEDCDNVGAKIAYITKKCLSTLRECLIYVFNNPLTEGIRSFVVDHIFPSIGDAVNRIAKLIFIDILGEGFKLLRKGAYNLFDNQFTRPVYRFTVDRVFPFIGNAVNRIANLIFDILSNFCLHVLEGIFNLFNNKVTRAISKLAVDYVFTPLCDLINKLAKLVFIDILGEGLTLLRKGAHKLIDNQFTRAVYRFTVDRVFPFIGNTVNRLAKLIFIDIILEFCTYVSDGIFNLLNNQVTRKLGNLALDYVIWPILDYTWFPFIDAVSEFFSVMYGGIDENPVLEWEEAKSPRKEGADSDSEGSEPDTVYVRNPDVI